MPLAVTFPLSGRFRDLHPLEHVRAGRTKKDRHVESPFFHVNRPWGVVNAILAWPVTEKYPVRVHGPHLRKSLRSPSLDAFSEIPYVCFSDSRLKCRDGATSDF